MFELTIPNLYFRKPQIFLFPGSMSTTGKEMIVEATLMDKMDNTTETTAKNTVESTTETIADETEVKNGTLLRLFNHSSRKFHFICTNRKF